MSRDRFPTKMFTLDLLDRLPCPMPRYAGLTRPTLRPLPRPPPDSTSEALPAARWFAEAQVRLHPPAPPAILWIEPATATVGVVLALAARCRRAAPAGARAGCARGARAAASAAATRAV